MSAAPKRDREVNRETARIFREIAETLGYMADALDDGDSIAGVMASRTLAAVMPSLPSHVRAAFTELLSDEAARSLQADYAYVNERLGLEG